MAVIVCLASMVLEVEKQFHFFLRKNKAFILKLKCFKCIGIRTDASNDVT